ncbi:MAG: GNAT family N-acetyltransferase [Gemmatimonadaceae bacterium]
MQKLTIRQAGPSDVGRFVRRFVAYRKFYDLPARSAEAQRFLRARLRRKEAVVLLAELGSRVAGFALVYPGFSSLRLAPAWTLNDLFVAPRYRRHGVARALLEAITIRARKAGVAVVSLSTQHTNVRAKPLYGSLGYAEDTEFAHYDLTVHAGAARR